MEILLSDMEKEITAYMEDLWDKTEELNKLQDINKAISSSQKAAQARILELEAENRASKEQNKTLQKEIHIMANHISVTLGEKIRAMENQILELTFENEELKEDTEHEQTASKQFEEELRITRSLSESSAKSLKVLETVLANSLFSDESASLSGQICNKCGN